MKRTACFLLTSAMLMSHSHALGMRNGTRSDKSKKNKQATIIKNDSHDNLESTLPTISRRSKSNPELARLIQDTMLLQRTITVQMNTSEETANKQQTQLSTLSHQIEELLEMTTAQANAIKTMNFQIAKLALAFQARYPGESIPAECAESILNTSDCPPKINMCRSLPLPEFTPSQARLWEGSLAAQQPAHVQTVGSIWESPAYVPAPKDTPAKK